MKFNEAMKLCIDGKKAYRHNNSWFSMWYICFYKGMLIGTTKDSFKKKLFVPYRPSNGDLRAKDWAVI